MELFAKRMCFSKVREFYKSKNVVIKFGDFMSLLDLVSFLKGGTGGRDIL